MIFLLKRIQKSSEFPYHVLPFWGILFFVTVILNIDRRDQFSLQAAHRLNVVVRLHLPRTVKREKVIGSRGKPAFLRVFPVIVKPAVDMPAAFCSLYIYKIDTLLHQR